MHRGGCAWHRNSCMLSATPSICSSNLQPCSTVMSCIIKHHVSQNASLSFLPDRQLLCPEFRGSINLGSRLAGHGRSLVILQRRSWGWARTQATLRRASCCSSTTTASCSMRGRASSASACSTASAWARSPASLRHAPPPRRSAAFQVCCAHDPSAVLITLYTTTSGPITFRSQMQQLLSA